MPEIEYPTTVNIDLQVRCALCMSELHAEVKVTDFEQTIKLEVVPCDYCIINEDN